MKRNRLSGDERTLLDQWMVNNASHIEFMEKYCPFTQLFNLLADWAAIDLQTELTGNNIKKSWTDTVSDRTRALGKANGDDQESTNFVDRLSKLEQQMDNLSRHRWSSLPQNIAKS